MARPSQAGGRGRQGRRTILRWPSGPRTRRCSSSISTPARRAARWATTRATSRRLRSVLIERPRRQMLAAIFSPACDLTCVFVTQSIGLRSRVRRFESCRGRFGGGPGGEGAGHVDEHTAVHDVDPVGRLVAVAFLAIAGRQVVGPLVTGADDAAVEDHALGKGSAACGCRRRRTPPAGPRPDARAGRAAAPHGSRLSSGAFSARRRPSRRSSRGPS